MLLLGDVKSAEKPAKCLQLDVPVGVIDLLPAAAEGLGGLKLEADGSFSLVTHRADKMNALFQRFDLAKAQGDVADFEKRLSLQHQRAR